MSGPGWSMSEADYEGKEMQWLHAPVICVGVLTAGLIAGLVSALRLSGRVEYGGIPLPNCQWLTSRCAVRVAAGGSLLAGLVGQLTALRHFILCWRGYDRAPIALTILMLLAYSLLGAALLLAAIGLRWKQKAPKVHEAFRQAAKASLLGGLAAGLAAEVLCNAGEPETTVPRDWRVGCAMLGASSGLLLLGLLAAQVDGQARLSTVEHSISITASEAGGVEERGSDAVGHVRLDSLGSEASTTTQDTATGISPIWPRRTSWHSWNTHGQLSSDPDWPHPRLQPDALRPHYPRSDAGGLREPLLLPGPGVSGWQQRRVQPQAAPRDGVGSGRRPLEACRGAFGARLPATPPLMVR